MEHILSQEPVCHSILPVLELLSRIIMTLLADAGTSRQSRWTSQAAGTIAALSKGLTVVCPPAPTSSGQMVRATVPHPPC